MRLLFHEHETYKENIDINRTHLFSSSQGGRDFPSNLGQAVDNALDHRCVTKVLEGVTPESEYLKFNVRCQNNKNVNIFVSTYFDVWFLTVPRRKGERGERISTDRMALTTG